MLSRKQMKVEQRLGSRPMNRRTQDLIDEGISLTPRLDAGLKAFPPVDGHDPNRDRAGKFIMAKIAIIPDRVTLLKDMEDVGCLEPLPQELVIERDTQEIQAICKEIVGPKGRVQPGIGRKFKIPTARDLGTSSASFRSSERMNEIVRTVAEQEARHA